jgi:thiamine-phosphate pyrophosphorylase
MKVQGLYVIVDPDAMKGRDPVEVADLAIRGGADIIQLRGKTLSGRELFIVGERLRELTGERGVPFIVNDRVDVAVAVRADGVHLGQEDLPIEAARRIVREDLLIGISTHGIEEAVDAERRGASYIGLGAMFPTFTKDDARYTGVEVLKGVKHHVTLPVVAIGGINESNVDEVLAAGADGIAVISAVVGAEDVEEAARRLKERIDFYRRM